MENLNAEQVKKALECCTNNDECVGEECPYYATGCENNMPKDALALINSQEQRIGELAEEVEDLKVTLLAWTMALTTLKAVKKELTEENERLTRLANLRQRDLDNANDLLFKAEDEIDRLRADTIDEFVKMVKEKMREVATGKRTSLIGAGWIDEIARELKGE